MSHDFSIRAGDVVFCAHCARPDIPVVRRSRCQPLADVERVVRRRVGWLELIEAMVLRRERKKRPA